MAATSTPLVWDFYREVSGAEGLGSCLEYFTEDAQSLYLADGLKTRLSFVEEGHWADAEPGSEITILADTPSLSAWDHALTGQLFGVGQRLSVDHKSHQNLAGGLSHAQIEVAQKALPGFLIVG